MSDQRQVSRSGWFAFLLAFILLAGLVQPVSASPPSAPKAPSNLKGVYYPLGIALLTWKDNANDETGFKVNLDFDCPIPNGVGTVSGGVTVDVKANTTSVKVKMQNGCKYAITLQAVGAKKDLSAKSNAVKLVAPPVPPTSLKVTKGKTNYELKWADNSDNEGIFAVAVGYKGGLKVFGYSKNSTSAAIPASAIPASAQYEWMVGAIPASAIPPDFKSGQTISASSLNSLAIPNNSDAKYLTKASYLPLFLGSNLVTTK